MFTRHSFLESLAALRTFERGDMWSLLAYLAMMGPVTRPQLRQAFWYMQRSFDENLHFLVKAQAVRILPDKWDGEPVICIAPEVIGIFVNVNKWTAPKTAETA